jgi:hypothetical protein
MAAIFQIRRGNSSYTSSLAAGELYLDQTSQNLIVGVTDSSKQITLLKLNDINTGSLHLTGDIRLSGSIYLGDSVGTDNISALGIFTTNLVPNGTIDLGTTSAKWDNAYINNLRAGNGVISGSSQILATLPTGIVSGSSQVLGGTGIVSGSQQIIGILSSLNEVSSSLISKTGSYATTGSNSFNGNQSINGNLYLTGSLIPSGNFVYDLGSATNGFGDVYLSSSTVYMNNNAIFGTTDVVPVQVGDYLQGGIVYYVDTVNGFSYIVSKTDIVLTDGITLERISGTTNSGLGGGIVNTNLYTSSASASAYSHLSPQRLCSDFSGSGYTDWYLPSTRELALIATNTNLMHVAGETTKLPYWSSTLDSNTSKLYYAGDGNKNDNLFTNLGYGNTIMFSVSSNLTSWPRYAYTKPVRRTNITEIIRTLSFPNFNFSGSINVAGTIDGVAIGAFVTQSNDRLTNLESSSANLNSFTASNGNTSLNLFSASLNTFTASNDNISLNSYTQSLKAAITASGTDVTINGNLTVKGTTTQIDSTQVNIGENIIELNHGGSQTTSGIITKDATGASTTSGSLLWDATTDYWKAGKLGSEAKVLTDGLGVISGSGQLGNYETTGRGIVSGSSQITYTSISSIPVGIVSGSSQITYGNISSIPIGIVSGSSQITPLLPTGVISGSSQITPLLPTGVVSGSIQVLGGTNIVSGSSQLTNSFDGRYVLETETGSYATTGSNSFNGNQSINGNLNVTGLINSDTITIISGSAQVVGILSSLNQYTGSNDTTNTTQNTRLSRLEESTSSLNTFSASMNAFYNNFTASLANNGFSASIDDRVDKLEYTASYGSAATIAGQFGTLQTVTASLMLATGSLQVFTASQEAKNIIIGNYTSSMNTFTASINGHISDINTWSASVKGHIVDINTKTGSLETTNTTQNTRLSRIEESTASLNLFTQSISTAYEGRATAAKTIFSGSSQVSYVGLSNIPSGIISSSAQIDTLFNIDGIVSGSSQINFTQLSGISPNIISSSSDTSNVDMIITGGSISANLYGGVVSGSAQITGVLTSLNSFTASNDNTSLNVATSSYETKGRGIVSGSIQVLGGSNVLSGSNQTNITSINQNLGTSTTGVQFASLGIGTAPDATYELKISGDVAASGDIVAYYTSDKRLKDNIQPIQNALDKVNELGGYTFDWNEELQKARKGHDIGVIAQEVQSVLPEVVVERDNGYLGVDYQKLVPVLIEAIKELSAKIKDLENK